MRKLLFLFGVERRLTHHRGSQSGRERTRRSFGVYPEPIWAASRFGAVMR